MHFAYNNDDDEARGSGILIKFKSPIRYTASIPIYVNMIINACNFGNASWRFYIHPYIGYYYARGTAYTYTFKVVTMSSYFSASDCPKTWRISVTSSSDAFCQHNGFGNGWDSQLMLTLRGSRSSESLSIDITNMWITTT